METFIKYAFVAFAITMAIGYGLATERPTKTRPNAFVGDMVIFALVISGIAVWWETPDLPATISKVAVAATIAVYGIVDVVGTYRHRQDDVIETSAASGIMNALVWIAWATTAMILWP